MAVLGLRLEEFVAVMLPRYHFPHPIWLFDPLADAGTVAVAVRPALAAAACLQGWARCFTEALSLWQDWTWPFSAEKYRWQLPEVW